MNTLLGTERDGRLASCLDKLSDCGSSCLFRPSSQYRRYRAISDCGIFSTSSLFYFFLICKTHCYSSRVDRKTVASQMVVFPNT